MISSTISVPTRARATEPLPPPRLMPPSTAAVSTVTSSPTPMSPPTVPRRAAKKSAPTRRQRAAGDVAGGDRAAHRDAGIVGRAARAADRGDVPARPQARHEDVAEDRDHDVEQSDAGNAEHVAVAHEVPGRDVGKRGGDGVGVVDQQQVVGRAVDDQRDQRGDEGAQPEIADQEAVDRAEQGAEGDGDDRDRRHRQTAARRGRTGRRNRSARTSSRPTGRCRRR